MTVDEELNVLEENIRRLKIEYDVYFGGGSKRAPGDTEWRVQSLLKKYSDSAKMNFAQRFKYNSIAQKYAVFSDLWRQKLKIKEEVPESKVAEWKFIKEILAKRERLDIICTASVEALVRRVRRKHVGLRFDARRDCCAIPPPAGRGRARHPS